MYKDKNNNLLSVQKTIAVLKQLASEPYTFSALELSNALNLNRSTVHRILSLLKEERLVLQNPYTKKYKLGPLTYHIGSAYLYSGFYTEDIIAIIDDLANKLQLSVGYSIKDGNDIINLYESDSFIRMGYKPGAFYPIHCGAYGKTIMAFHEPLEELEKIVYSTPLDKRNENTITDPQVLLREYEKIRKQGYAISDEENIKGAIGIGAPVRNSKGKVFGCIAAAGIKASINKDRLDDIIKAIVEGANKISSLIP